MVLGVLGLGFYDMLFSLLSSLVVFNNCMGGFECGGGTKFWTSPPLWFTCGEHEIDQDTYFLKELEALIFFPALKD